MKAHWYFGLAACALGITVGLIETGIAKMISEQADKSWEKVTSPANADTQA